MKPGDIAVIPGGVEHEGYFPEDAEAIDFFARGLISAPYKVVGLSELNSVYDLMKKGAIAGRYVLDTSK